MKKCRETTGNELLLPPAFRGNGEGNVFTRVCLSVHMGEGTYLGRGGIPTLGQEWDTYLGWGIPTLAGGGGTYLGWEVPTLDRGGTYLGRRRGVPTLAGGYLPWPGRYLSWLGGTPSLPPPPQETEEHS